MRGKIKIMKNQMQRVVVQTIDQADIGHCETIEKWISGCVLQSDSLPRSMKYV